MPQACKKLISFLELPRHWGDQSIQTLAENSTPLTVIGFTAAAGITLRRARGVYGGLEQRLAGDEPLEGLERVAAFFVTLRAVQNS
jgi:hypothetical protein